MKQMIGISVGSQNTVVGVLKNANVDIILSETSSRCVPTMVAFQERERTFGDSALSTIKSNYTRTVVHPNRWLGIQADWPFIKDEAKYATSQPLVDKHNKIGFEINYKNEQDVYYPETCMGMFFNKLKLNWKTAGYDTKEVVVSVPDYYTAYERKAMLDAMTIADLHCTALLNESSAIAIEYGLKRRSQFDEKVPKIVAFVDMGHSKTTVSFASFTKNAQKVISVTSERFCGAREFDYLLMAHVSAFFQKKYGGSDPMNSPKCRLRLSDAIAKVRKTLTVNREAAINVESLIDDDDLSYMLTRDEFEQIIAPVTEKFRNILKLALTNAMTEAKFTVEDLSSVEMAGDAVRTPIIQQIIKETYNHELSKTLLPDECLARGCTFFAAMNSPFFSLRDFTFEHFNPYSVVLEYPFLKDGQVQLRTHTIIKKGENIPCRKSIKFTEKQTPKQDVIQLRCFYNNEEHGFLNNTLLTTYMASIPHVKEEQWTFALQFYLDQNGLPHLDKASINEVYYDEVPVKATATPTPTPTTTTEGEKTATTETKPEEKKTDKVKKERSTLCIVKMIECLIGLPQTILDTVTSKEANQENEDRLLTMAINKRNEVENFIYSTRSKFDGELGAYVTSDEKEVLLAMMQKVEDWFYSGDEEVYNKTVLESKSKDLSELGSTIYKRYHDWNKLSESLEKLERVVNLNIKKLQEITTQTSYLTQADRDELAQIIVQYNNLLNEGKTSYTKFPKFGDAPAKHQDVDKASEEFVKKCSTVFQTAEKRFKDELKKKEEEEKKKKEAAKTDVKMNDATVENNATTTDNSQKENKEFDINMDVD